MDRIVRLLYKEYCQTDNHPLVHQMFDRMKWVSQWAMRKQPSMQKPKRNKAAKKPKRIKPHIEEKQDVSVTDDINPDDINSQIDSYINPDAG